MSFHEIKSKIPTEMLVWNCKHDVHLKGNYFLNTIKIRYEDRTFLKTTGLMRFRPGSELLKFWTIFMIGLVLTVMLVYPILIIFNPYLHYPPLFLTLQLLVLICYALDLFVECTTGIISERGYELDMKLILRKKFSSKIFIIDIVAAIPFGFCLYILFHTGFLKMNILIFKLLQCQCLIKAVKVDTINLFINNN